MERLILFAVAAIIWSVVKALSQPAPKRPVPRQAAPKPPQGLESGDKSQVSRTRESYARKGFSPQLPDLPLQVEELEETGVQELPVSSDDLVRGVIMAEVLGPPRSKRPHRFSHRVN